MTGHHTRLNSLLKSKHCIAVIAIFFFHSLLLLKFSDIFQPLEAREGSVVKAILQDNTWAMPVRSSFALASKPPLFHWIGAALATLTGTYNEFYLRLPSLLAAVGTLIVVAVYAYKVAGPLASVFAPAILSTMYGFSLLASAGQVDMLFCFFVTSATLVGLKGVNEKLSSGGRLKIAALSGFAAISNGLIGIAIPIIIILASRLILKGRTAIREIVGIELLLAPLIAAPWYLYAFLQTGGSVFNLEVISDKSFWFYFLDLLGQGAPWSVLFAIYLFILIKNSYRRGSGLNKNNRFLPLDKKVSQAVLNGLIWFGVLLVLLTFGIGGRHSYLLLFLPSIALILAFRFSTAMDQFGHGSALPALIRKYRYQIASWGILTCLIGMIPGVLVFGVSAPDSILKLAPGLGLILSNLEAVSVRGGWTLLVLFGVASALSITLWTLGAVKQRSKFLGYALIIFLNLIVTLYTQCWLCYKSLPKSYKRIGLRLTTLIPLEVPLNLIKEPADDSFDALLFYYGRGVKLFDPKKIPSIPGLYLTRRSWLDEHQSGNIKEILVDSRSTDEAGEEIELIQVN